MSVTWILISLKCSFSQSKIFVWAASNRLIGLSLTWLFCSLVTGDLSSSAYSSDRKYVAGSQNVTDFILWDHAGKYLQFCTSLTKEGNCLCPINPEESNRDWQTLI